MEKVTVNNTTDGIKQVAAVAAGLAVGKITADKATAMLHPLYGPLAGSIVMGILAVKAKNKYAKNFFAGIGAVHLVSVIKSATAGKTGFLSVVNSYTPSLNGMRGMRGLGNYDTARMLGSYEENGGAAAYLGSAYQDDSAELLTGNFTMN